jgi:hypothetical protein
MKYSVEQKLFVYCTSEHSSPWSKWRRKFRGKYPDRSVPCKATIRSTAIKFYAIDVEQRNLKNDMCRLKEILMTSALDYKQARISRYVLTSCPRTSVIFRRSIVHRKSSCCSWITIVWFFTKQWFRTLCETDSHFFRSTERWRKNIQAFYVR